MEIDLGHSLCPSILMRESAKAGGQGREKGSFGLKDEQKTWQKGVSCEMKSFNVPKVCKMDLS